MAVGKPVIKSDTGGVRTLVKHQSTGLLVKAGDVNGLGQAIIRLLDDVHFRDALSRTALENAEEFSAEKHVDRMFILYKCLSQGN